MMCSYEGMHTQMRSSTFEANMIFGSPFSQTQTNAGLILQALNPVCFAYDFNRLQKSLPLSLPPQIGQFPTYILSRARDSCWLLEYDQAIQLFSMEVCIGDIHAGRPADHQINCFQVCCWTVCSDSLCGFLITSFNKSTFELDLMFFTFSLKVQILVCVYPLRIYLVYDLLVEVSGALPPQLV